MKLVARDNAHYFKNLSLWFVDEARGVETYLCDVSNMVLSNTPYAPDEFYSYAASLHQVQGRLYVRVVQGKSVVDVSEREVMCYVSVDSGITWTGTAALATLGPANELCSLS